MKNFRDFLLEKDINESKAKIAIGSEEFVKKVESAIKKVGTPNAYTFTVTSSEVKRNGETVVFVENEDGLDEHLIVYTDKKGKYSSVEYKGFHTANAKYGYKDTLWLGNIDDEIGYLQDLSKFLHDLDKVLK